MAAFVPAALVACVIAFAVLAYLIRTRFVFRNESRSPEHQLDHDQVSRFESLRFAQRLQMDVNRWHNTAIWTKTVYEGVGVAVCSAAPALIWLGAADTQLRGAELSSTTGVLLAQAATALGVLVVVRLFRFPARSHVVARLRAETLRFHLHAYLAAVGPYARDDSEAESIAQYTGEAPLDSLLTHLRDRERRCLSQASGAESLPSLPQFGAKSAEAYYIERVGEQERWFTDAKDRLEAPYRRSAALLFGLLAAAGCSALAQIFLPGADLPRALFFLCGGGGVLVLGLRSVFGFDSRSSLYVRQLMELRPLIGQLEKSLRELEAGRGDQLEFRRNAARFEAMMAREACDWVLISDRHYYDASI